MTTIIVTNENNEVEKHDFEPEIRSISLGRRSTNDVCISNMSVSGTHARIVLGDGGASIEDLNSTNGTYINGTLVSRQPLNDGDDIIMGRVRVTFVAAASTEKAVRGDLSDTNAPLIDDSSLLADASAEQSFAEPDAMAKPDIERPVARPAAENTPDGVTALDTPSSRETFEPERAEQPTALYSVSSQAAEPAVTVERTAATATAVATESAGIEHELDSATSSSAVIEIKTGAKSGQVLPIDKPVTTLGRPGIQIAAIMKKPDGYFLMHIESDENVGPPQLNNSSIGDEPVLLQSGDALNVAGIDVQFMLS